MINKKIIGSHENENTTYQKLWDRAKTVLRENFIVMTAYIKKTERMSIQN
jgi:hypothetical protein